MPDFTVYSCSSWACVRPDVVACLQFSFKTFGDLQAMTVNRDTYVTADILAVISTVNDAVTIMTKAEKGRLLSAAAWLMIELSCMLVCM